MFPARNLQDLWLYRPRLWGGRAGGRPAVGKVAAGREAHGLRRRPAAGTPPAAPTGNIMPRFAKMLPKLLGKFADSPTKLQLDVGAS